ncbi:MAG: hypothetical protein GY710_07405 [Desulfobacteraceae bacterium]|nr:hypothetical protein [Desulfobacteraceae bacterium]
MPESCVRQVLPNVMDFKKFWKDKPFKYVLTSNEFPPTLLEPEEWIFSDDINLLLKELMQFDQRKMTFVQSPFNPKNKNILRPEGLSPWKINHFPEEWNIFVCEVFVPEGHLTCLVTKEADSLKQIDASMGVLKESTEKQNVEKAFFSLLEQHIEKMGYLLLKPLDKSKYASINSYISAWEEDEKEAGLL